MSAEVERRFPVDVTADLRNTDGMNDRKLTLKVSDELAERIQAIAKREHRSAHAQMLVFLERAVAEYEAAEEAGS